MSTRTIFLRALEAQDKAAALLAAIRDPETAQGNQRFEVDTTSFASVPRSPFAYWVSEQVRARFTALPAFEAQGRVARRTNGTTDDARWIRLIWEVPRSQCWAPHAKGGAYSEFWSDLHLVIAWDPERNSYPGYLGTAHRPDLRPASLQYFFRPGLTWSRRSQKGFSMRVLPSGAIFGDKGPGCFDENDSEEELLAALAVSNSVVFRYLLALQMAFGSYEAGAVQSTPYPNMRPQERPELARLSRRAWSLKRSLDTRTDTSHAFTLPALLQIAGPDVATRVAEWSEHVRTVEAELAGIQAEIDERCFALYDIDEADRRATSESFGGGASEAASSDDGNEADDDAGENGVEEEDDSAADATDLAAELVSWAVGVAFGRFDMRLATGARPMPTEPEPFDPLPACSPGMLTGGDGLPLARPPAGYPLAFPEAGVLVDDRGHAQDLPTAVRAVFDAVFGAGADRWWNDVAALLDPKGHDLRVWLADSFFEHHLKRHSKSRRKAPILWQLATPSGGYSVWLHAHRLTRDSFFQLQNEVIGPKLTHQERQLTSLIQNAGGSPSAPDRKEIAAQESFVEELRAFRDEVARIAPLWNPDPNDGVIINFAPLWRLVPQHRAWQKECKDCWDKLVAGEYDWAHLAMHLWPERVVQKCADDRSLAIAHGLEDVFWVEGSDGKWQKRTVDHATIGRLITERTSPAVKDALKSLLHAPAPSTGRGGGKRTAAPRRAVATLRSTRETASSAGNDAINRVREAITEATGGVSKADIVAATGITDGQWNVAINVLLAQDLVTKTGGRRAARYRNARIGDSS